MPERMPTRVDWTERWRGFCWPAGTFLAEGRSRVLAGWPLCSRCGTALPVDNPSETRCSPACWSRPVSIPRPEPETQEPEPIDRAVASMASVLRSAGMLP